MELVPAPVEAVVEPRPATPREVSEPADAAAVRTQKRLARPPADSDIVARAEELIAEGRLSRQAIADHLGLSKSRVQRIATRMVDDSESAPILLEAS